MTTLNIDMAKQLHMTTVLDRVIKLLDDEIIQATSVSPRSSVTLDNAACAKFIEPKQWGDVIENVIQHYEKHGYKVDVIKGRYLYNPGPKAVLTSGTVAGFTLSGWV